MEINLLKKHNKIFLIKLYRKRNNDDNYYFDFLKIDDINIYNEEVDDESELFYFMKIIELFTKNMLELDKTYYSLDCQLKITRKNKQNYLNVYFTIKSGKVYNIYLDKVEASTISEMFYRTKRYVSLKEFL